jgi:hypothetical protein
VEPVLLTVEHRGAPAPDPLGLALAGDDNVHLELVSDETDEAVTIVERLDGSANM